MLTRFEDYVLDTERRLLATLDGAAVHLTPKAFDLLVLLTAEAPRVVSKAEIHERIWVDSFVSDATLAGLVKELRRALRDVDRESPIIRTAHGVGYAFGASFSTAPARTGSAHWLVFDDRRVVLQPGRNLVGRDPAAEIWIDAACVSRRHAHIQVGNDVRVEDLGSKNGTTARGQQVAGSAALCDGDQLEFGWIRCVYRSSLSGMSTETQNDER